MCVWEAAASAGVGEQEGAEGLAGGLFLPQEYSDRGWMLLPSVAQC